MLRAGQRDVKFHMHPSAQTYFEMSSSQQKHVQLLLCERALEVWATLMPNNLRYIEGVAGTEQELDVQLPRKALAAVRSGGNGVELDQQYSEPLAALQDDDLVLSEKAEYAFYAIYNLFATWILEKELDPWLVPNQALASLGEDEAMQTLEWALNAAV